MPQPEIERLLTLTRGGDATAAEQLMREAVRRDDRNYQREAFAVLQEREADRFVIHVRKFSLTLSNMASIHAFLAMIGEHAVLTCGLLRLPFVITWGLCMRVCLRYARVVFERFIVPSGKTYAALEMMTELATCTDHKDLFHDAMMAWERRYQDQEPADFGLEWLREIYDIGNAMGARSFARFLEHYAAHLPSPDTEISEMLAILQKIIFAEIFYPDDPEKGKTLCVRNPLATTWWRVLGPVAACHAHPVNRQNPDAVRDTAEGFQWSWEQDELTHPQERRHVGGLGQWEDGSQGSFWEHAPQHMGLHRQICAWLGWNATDTNAHIVSIMARGTTTPPLALDAQGIAEMIRTQIAAADEPTRRALGPLAVKAMIHKGVCNAIGSLFALHESEIQALNLTAQNVTKYGYTVQAVEIRSSLLPAVDPNPGDHVVTFTHFIGENEITRVATRRALNEFLTYVIENSSFRGKPTRAEALLAALTFCPVNLRDPVEVIHRWAQIRAHHQATTQIQTQPQPQPPKDDDENANTNTVKPSREDTEAQIEKILPIISRRLGHRTAAAWARQQLKALRK